jgi:hypothetical protein
MPQLLLLRAVNKAFSQAASTPKGAVITVVGLLAQQKVQ